MNKKKITTDAQILAKEYTAFIADSRKSLSGFTIKGYDDTICLFFDFLEKAEKINIDSFSSKNLSRESIERFLDWLENSKQSKPQTCNVRLGALRAYVKYLAGKRPEYRSLFIDLSFIKQRKISHPYKETPMTQNAVKALIAAPGIKEGIGLKYTTIMSMLYTTAIRIDELLSIKMKDLHLDCAKPWVTVVGKGRKARTVYLPSKVVTLITKHIESEYDKSIQLDGYLFFSPVKGYFCKASARGINKQIKKYALIAKQQCSEVPSDVHCHKFRHSSATHCLENKMRIEQVSKMLGHQNIKTTMDYIGITDKMREEAIQNLEDNATKSIKPLWKKDDKKIVQLFGFNNR